VDTFWNAELFPLVFYDLCILVAADLVVVLALVIVVLSGVKVSQNAPERHCGAQKFKPGAFRLQNYWISQPEPTFLGPAS